MESDLNTLQLITSKNEIDASPAVVRGKSGRKVLRSEHGGYSPGTRGGLEPQELHPDFKTRRSEALEPAGAATTAINSFLQAAYEDGQDAGDRCASKTNIHLDLLDEGTGENPGPDYNGEDEILADAIRNAQSEIIYESLLRREREILRGCDALSRRFKLLTAQSSASIVDREDMTVRTDKVSVSVRVAEPGIRVSEGALRAPFLVPPLCPSPIQISIDAYC